MPDNGLIQKTDAHEMAHGRPVQITEHTTVTELQPSLSDVVCANKKLQIGFIVALVVLALLSGFVARPHLPIPRLGTPPSRSSIKRRAMFWRSQPRASPYLRVSLRCRAIQERQLPSSSRSFRETWVSCLPCSTLKISADHFMVGRAGHPDSVLARTLRGVAWHSRTLEHERSHSPRGNACAGGRHDRHGACTRERVGIAKGR